MRRWWLLGALALAGCPASATDEVLSSTTLATAKERVDVFCGLALCPLRPEDVRFHLVRRGSLTGLWSADERLLFEAVVKVTPSEIHFWSKGCADARLPMALPAWVAPVLEGAPWTLRSQPSLLKCTGDERRVYVKEAVVLWSREAG